LPNSATFAATVASIWPSIVSRCRSKLRLPPGVSSGDLSGAMSW